MCNKDEIAYRKKVRLERIEEDLSINCKMQKQLDEFQENLESFFQKKVHLLEEIAFYSKGSYGETDALKKLYSVEEEKEDFRKWQKEAEDYMKKELVELQKEETNTKNDDLE